MHLPRNALAALLLLPCILAASSAPPRIERWEASSSPWRAPPIWRGETVGLECAMPCADLSGAAASFHWQTNGMGGAWWSAPASATNGVLSAVWTPAMDAPGADWYRFFIRAETEGGVTYRANGSITMLGSPGETPDVLEPPFPLLDFNAIEVANAPWATPADVAVAVEAARFAAAPVTSVNGATGDVVVAVVDLGAFAATGTVAAAGTAGFADGALTAQRLDMPWGLAGHAAVNADRIVREHPGVHGGQGVAYTNDLPVSSGRLATVGDVEAAAAELAAIRAAADGIELPEDPTAAELGAAFRDLLLCIRNPARAIRARAAAPAQEETR